MVCESVDGGLECEREEKAVSGFVKVYEQDCESSKIQVGVSSITSDREGGVHVFIQLKVCLSPD